MNLTLATHSRLWTVVLVLMAAVIATATRRPSSASNAIQPPIQQPLKGSAHSGEAKEFVQLHEFRDLKLNCSGVPDNKVNWTKDGDKLEAASITNYELQFEPGVSRLHIMKANTTDIGTYECRHQVVVKTFEVRAKPRVKFNITMYRRSETVVVSASWKLGCQFTNALYALDAKISLVRCQKDPTTAGNEWCDRPNLRTLQDDTKKWATSNAARVKMYENESQNGTMISVEISAAHYQDMGYYMCVGTNFLAHSQTVMYLRVRDKFDFVWPLVLFVGLAMYLISLVVIFENRRIQATSFLKLEWDKFN